MASSGGEGGAPDNSILELGILLLKDFLYKWIQRHVDGLALTREQLGAAEICEPKHKKVAQCLQVIGDELDGNAELQRTIDDPSLVPNMQTFKNIVFQVFSDGKINWGRVVTLFYFACKFIIKAYEVNVPDIIRTIITWTVDFLRENVINWIREQGGWEGVYSYFGTPTWQTVMVFLAGVLTTVIVMRRM